MFPVHQIWPKPSFTAQWKGEEDKADRKSSGKQHQGMDMPEACQVPAQGNGAQRKMEETGCEVIRGAPTTPAVKEQVKGWRWRVLGTQRDDPQGLSGWELHDHFISFVHSHPTVPCGMERRHSHGTLELVQSWVLIQANPLYGAFRTCMTLLLQILPRQWRKHQWIPKELWWRWWRRGIMIIMMRRTPTMMMATVNPRPPILSSCTIWSLSFNNSKETQTLWRWLHGLDAVAKYTAFFFLFMFCRQPLCKVISLWFSSPVFIVSPTPTPIFLSVFSFLFFFVFLLCVCVCIWWMGDQYSSFGYLPE